MTVKSLDWLGTSYIAGEVIHEQHCSRKHGECRNGDSCKKLIVPRPDTKIMMLMLLMMRARVFFMINTMTMMMMTKMMMMIAIVIVITDGDDGDVMFVHM